MFNLTNYLDKSNELSLSEMLRASSEFIFSQRIAVFAEPDRTSKGPVATHKPIHHVKVMTAAITVASAQH
jgi:hypothetical protein